MFNIIEQLPGYIAWKDTSHRYLGCNRNLAEVYGFSDPNQIIGLRDEDINENSEDSLTFYYDGDMLALSGKTVKVIHNIGSPDASKSFLLEKKPLFSNEKNIIGTIFQCQELKEN